MRLLASCIFLLAFITPVIAQAQESYTLAGMTNISERSSPTKAGRVSHFERKMIVPGGPDGTMTPCEKNFDAIMDNLEGLMSEQINENNRMAAEQAARYSR